MERPIQQDFTPVWRLLRLCVIPPAFAGVAAAIAFYAHGQKDPTKLLIDALVFFLAFAPLLLVVALSRMQPSVKWFISDTGLMRVIRGKALVIPWAWIYHMANTKSGFYVRWRYPREPGVSAIDLEHRAVFYPIKADADELIALWHRNISSESQKAGKIHYRARNRQASQQVIVMGRFLMFVGAVLIGWGGLTIARQYPSTSWPSVEGKILFQLYNITGRAHPKGEVTLSYEYAVAGQTNHSTQYSLAHATFRDLEQTANVFAQSHQRGAIVTVFYNPKHPEEAVLQTGPSWRDDGSLMLLGGFFAFVGVLCRVIDGVAKRAQKTLAD